MKHLETTQSLANLQSRTELAGRTLILTAHPDDELACAALLQRMREPLVVITTDGAPSDPYFWSQFGTRENYAAVRRQEATASLQNIGVPSLWFLNDRTPGVRFTDQALHKNLINAVLLLVETIRELVPDAILAPAYEGGHPDHDSCSFLAAVAGNVTGVPVWEMPLYHRGIHEELVWQEFRELVGNEIFIAATADELRGREKMVKSHKSQADLPYFISSQTESYRPQATYDYSRPPHAGFLNYEVWKWGVNGEEVSFSMTNCRTYLKTAKGAYFHPGLPTETMQTLRLRLTASGI
jgi:LmbE family N-acetylglucosaminyl deacetylase